MQVFLFFNAFVPFLSAILKNFILSRRVFYRKCFLSEAQNINFLDFVFYDAWKIAVQSPVLQKNDKLAMSYKKLSINAGQECLNCGDPIVYGTGRSDRRFCCEDCKNAWHNEKKTGSWHRYRDRVNTKLEHNRNILWKLYKMGIKSIDRLSIKSLGFDDDYATSFYKVGKKCIVCCFDMKYETTPTRLRNIACLAEPGTEGWGLFQ